MTGMPNERDHNMAQAPGTCCARLSQSLPQMHRRHLEARGKTRSRWDGIYWTQGDIRAFCGQDIGSNRFAVHDPTQVRPYEEEMACLLDAETRNLIPIHWVLTAELDCNNILVLDPWPTWTSLGFNWVPSPSLPAGGMWNSPLALVQDARTQIYSKKCIVPLAPTSFN